MQAVVKTPRIEVAIKGDIPPKLIAVLQEEFGADLHCEDEDDAVVVDIFASDWYRETKAGITPGDNLKIYRENQGWTQVRLGEVLGGIPRQHVSNMERGIRPISIKMARKLARVFRVSPDKFI